MYVSKSSILLTETPQFVKDIMAFLRAGGLTSTYTCVGAQKPNFSNFPDVTEEVLPFTPTWDAARGPLFREGVTFHCNGKRGHSWRFSIAVDRGQDLLVVWLYGLRNGKFTLLSSHAGVHIDDMPAFVDEMYDEAIRQHCNGFIPM